MTITNVLAKVEVTMSSCFPECTCEFPPGVPNVSYSDSGLGSLAGGPTHRGGIYKGQGPHKDQAGEQLRLSPHPTRDLPGQGPEGMGPGGAARPPPAAVVTVKSGSAGADRGQRVLGGGADGTVGGTTNGDAGQAEPQLTAGLRQAIRPRRICFGFTHGTAWGHRTASL